MQWRLGLRELLLLCACCVPEARTAVKSGRYFLLNRHFGKYLLDNEALGLAADAALWSLELQEDGRAQIGNVKTGRSLGAQDEWHIHAVCRARGVSLVNGKHEVLAVKHISDEVAQLIPNNQAAQEGAQWLLLPPCLGEDPHEAQRLGWGECFPQGSEWGAMAQDCCNLQLHGSQGNPTCWDGRYTFERCCPDEVQGSALREPLAAADAATMAPQLLCSGERLQGSRRYVRQASYDGERMWHLSSSLEATFDFTTQGTSMVSMVQSLPACGGPELFEEAASILEEIELHHISILRDLHEAMLKLSLRPAKGKAHVWYLPFFPYLLMALHRRTLKLDYLHCISRTAAVLAAMEPWKRNAGYDFVLPIGYERPWERRGVAEGAAEADPYLLQTYDVRFGNALLLATHNLFFGDRFSVLSPNYGGAAYRTLRNVVVPLPFTLNCRAWRHAKSQLWKRFRVSFAGSQNGETRRLIHRAAVKLQGAGFTDLAVRFVVEDEARAKLAKEPASVLRAWFGDDVRSFDDLLLKSHFCLVLPGDVSDLAMRFFHALSAGCVPVIVGGPSTTVPLPFAEFVNYSRFARFAHVGDVSDAEQLLNSLQVEADPTDPGHLQELLSEISGLFMRHEECGVVSSEPFLELLEKSFEERWKIWQLLKWYN